ncbi:hypothetical protein BDV95DRAFT_601685 [Massariosphaeria phaeospora]|uniref:Transmembrane protein n=1 Tax=Massariosphaeria phaeospora TaxID=100035 RepID=A0A7C8IDY5_9PLEO|nr:hypothetical protein BDV95DRAFT_601685 [Massariosphaeria phaeospora]
MVDQNSSPHNAPPSPESSHESQTKNTMSAPSVVRAGEMMLVFGLLLVFLVCSSLALHFYLKRRKRGRRGKKGADKKNKKKTKGLEGPELHSQDKKMAELVGTPVCEMGESEPRHEMQDVEVDERHMAAVHGRRPSESDVESGVETEFGTQTDYGTHTATAAPEIPVYWSARL